MTDPTEALDRLDVETAEYLAWAEEDVPPTRTFEDWHDKGTVLLRRLARSGAEGLDVDRLRRAFRGYSLDTDGPDVIEAIAAEYVRLHPSEPHQDETP